MATLDRSATFFILFVIRIYMLIFLKSNSGPWSLTTNWKMSMCSSRQAGSSLKHFGFCRGLFGYCDSILAKARPSSTTLKSSYRWYLSLNMTILCLYVPSASTIFTQSKRSARNYSISAARWISLSFFPLIFASSADRTRLNSSISYNRSFSTFLSMGFRAVGNLS